jgi:hypothetical protein
MPLAPLQKQERGGPPAQDRSINVDGRRVAKAPRQSG